MFCTQATVVYSKHICVNYCVPTTFVKAYISLNLSQIIRFTNGSVRQKKSVYNYNPVPSLWQDWAQHPHDEPSTNVALFIRRNEL